MSETNDMLHIPPVSPDVADKGPGDVPEVPAAVAEPMVAAEPKVKRLPVDHMTANLYWPFIIMMGKIAMYAQTKYGAVEQYADGRLVGEKSPINHIAGHISEYVQRKPHDKFGNLQMQLAAIAYNAMMECVYLDQGGGPTVPSKLYDSVQKDQSK